MSSTWINKVFPPLLKKKKKNMEMSEEGGGNRGGLCVTTDSRRAQELTSRTWWHCSAFWHFARLAASQPSFAACRRACWRLKVIL